MHLRVPPQDAVFDLVRGERDVVLGQLGLHLQHLFVRVVGHAHCAREALVDALGQSLGDRLDALWVRGSVDEVDVDVIELEPLQAALERLVWRIRRVDVVLHVHGGAEPFGLDDEAVSRQALDQLSDDALRLAAAVGLGRVDEVDAGVVELAPGGLDGWELLFLVAPGALVAPRPGADADVGCVDPSVGCREGDAVSGGRAEGGWHDVLAVEFAGNGPRLAAVVAGCCGHA